MAPTRVVALAACALVLGGCAGEGLGVGENARKGGTATVGLDRAPGSLDPAVASGPEARMVVRQLYVGPLTLRRARGMEGTEVIPGLARALPTVSDRGLTWRLQLRRGLRYSDGTPLKASDLAHSLRRVRALSPTGRRLFARVESVEADDRSGVVVYRLSEPDRTFAQVLASTWAAPVPGDTPLTDQAGRPPPGIGPYRLARGRGTLLVRRRGFRLPDLPEANVDRIVVTVEPDPERRARRTLTGDLDATVGTLPAQRLPELRSKFARRYDESVALGTTMFTLDSGSAPFDDIRVRQAANFAVDNEAFGRVLDGRLRAGCTVLPPAVSGYREPDPCPWGEPSEPGDLRQAASLMRDAGAEGARVTVGAGRSRSDRAVARSFARTAAQARACGRAWSRRAAPLRRSSCTCGPRCRTPSPTCGRLGAWTPSWRARSIACPWTPTPSAPPRTGRRSTRRSSSGPASSRSATTRTPPCCRLASTPRTASGPTRSSGPICRASA